MHHAGGPRPSASWERGPGASRPRSSAVRSQDELQPPLWARVLHDTDTAGPGADPPLSTCQTGGRTRTQTYIAEIKDNNFGPPTTPCPM